MDDLSKIKDISLKKINLLKQETDLDISDLKLFENLSECSLYKFSIVEKDIMNLKNMKNLEYIYFDFCDFNVDKLEFSNSVFKVYFNMCQNLELDKFECANLNKIKIIGDKNNKLDFDLSLLKNVKNLEILDVHNYKLKNILKLLKEAPNLKEMNLDGCLIDEFLEIDMIKSIIKISNEKDFRLTGAMD